MARTVMFGGAIQNYRQLTRLSILSMPTSCDLSLVCLSDTMAGRGLPLLLPRRVRRFVLDALGARRRPAAPSCEVDRLRQRAGRDSQRRPSENGRPEGQRIGGNRRRVLRVRERAARALGVWARRKRTWSGAPTGTRSGAGATSLELADEGSPCSCLLFLAPCLPCGALRRLDTVGMRSETITVSTCTQRPHRTW